METGIDIPEDWSRFAELLTISPWRRVLVLGAGDRGKSTLCRFLAADPRLGKPWLLDTDPGQKLIGPPACVTAGPIGGASPRLYFVGGVDPVRRIAMIVAGAARLASGLVEDRSAGRLLINTGGMVDGPGRLLKRLKIDALRPDWIVALQHGEELEPLLAPLPPGRVHRLAPSPAAFGKTPLARAALRQAALSEALRGARSLDLSCVVYEMLERSNGLEQHCGKLCGLTDRDGEEQGIGVLTGADVPAGTATVFTSVPPDRIRRIRIGMALKPEILAAVGLQG
jgi:polynucleotide 5'-hydroxyl-kinase GRC3/NOL9